MQPEIASLFKLAGRVAFLSGAAGHLGAAMAEALAGAGAFVLLNGRNYDRLKDLEAKLTGRGLGARACPFDVADGKTVEEYFRSVMAEFGRLDILVNNAYSGKAATVEHATAADFAFAYDIGVTAAFRCVQAALPALRAAEGASVINIASMYGMVSPDPRVYDGDSGMNNPPFYGAAKGALIQLTRYLACHLAADKIRVNAISPGAFPPDTVAPKFRSRLEEKVPMARLGRPDELRGVIVFLASSASAYVTGINLPVDGGWTAW